MSSRKIMITINGMRTVPNE